MTGRASFNQELPRLICIADPTSLRWQAFKDAIRQFAQRTGRNIQTGLIDWRELIAVKGDLRKTQGFDASSYDKSPALLRIESPARDFEVTRALLAAGANATGVAEGTRWSEVEFAKGKLIEPRLIFAGLKSVLSGIDESVQHVAGIELLSNTLDIASMFDKNATSNRLMAAGIATPEIDELSWLLSAGPGNPTPRDFSAAAMNLIGQLRKRNRKSAYVKLNSGSSSSGILLVELFHESNFKAVSTMASIDGCFHNTRSLQELDAEGLGRRLDYLFQQGVTVQQGISKSLVGGHNFDVRVVVIDGKVEFTIFRVSQHPFTNLHLGGYRGDWQECRNLIPDRIWFDAMDDCVAAAKLYQAHVVGIDLVFDRNYLNHTIIELNPFGDFLPGWKNEAGETIYEVELRTLFGE